MFTFLRDRKKKQELRWKRETAYSALKMLQFSVDAAREVEVVSALALADDPADESARQHLDAARTFLSEAGHNAWKLMSSSPRLIEEGVEYTCTHGFRLPDKYNTKTLSHA